MVMALADERDHRMYHPSETRPVCSAYCEPLSTKPFDSIRERVMVDRSNRE